MKKQYIYLCIIFILSSLSLRAQVESPVTYSYGFEEGLVDWTQDTDDDRNWILKSGATASNNTGPSSASEGSYYMYTESSGYYNKTARITSIAYAIYENTSLTFDYHMYGSTMGILMVEASINGGVTWQNLWSKSGNYGNNWYNAIVDLSSVEGSSVIFRFNGETGTSIWSDMAIDNIIIAPEEVIANNTIFSYSTSFEDDFGGWYQDGDDDINWTHKRGSTSSTRTGPSAANEGTHYMYTEASGYYNKTANLTVNADIYTNPVFTFDYHMYGSTTGTLMVEASTNGGVSWQNLWSKSGDQGNSWYTAEVDISDFKETNVIFRFIGETGTSIWSDIAIDNIVLTSVYKTHEEYTDVTLSDDENYAFTRQYQFESTTRVIEKQSDVIESITYFDGLGRAKQNIGIKQSPTGDDIVTHIAYDSLGRQDKEYLPYVVSSNNGGIVESNLTNGIAEETENYYKDNYADDFAGVSLPTNAYSQKSFEPSPLNRVLQQAAPGQDWRLGSGHEIDFEYLANTDADAVKQYEFTTNLIDGVYEPTLATGTVSNHDAGELYKTITKDENHTGTTSKLHTTEEFKNKQGQVLLKRTYAYLSLSGVEAHDTYYVYDDYGNLTYVFPPKVTTEDTNAVSTIELSELCYQYKYDNRNRLVKKKIPGKGWESIIYDKLDRPVLTQDANLRAANNWLYTKYDQFGRVAYTGLVNTTETLNDLRIVASNGTSTTQYETMVTQPFIEDQGGTDLYYTAYNPLTTGFADLYTISYYDDYIDLPSGLTNTIPRNYNEPFTTNTKGLPTVSKVRVLETDYWITTVTYYDEKARPIYVYSENNYLNTIDIVESKLDFVGRVLETKNSHQKTGQDDIIVTDVFEYDKSGRLLTQNQQIEGQLKEEIAKNNYDELGQLASKEVGNGLQTVDYTYNVRGWLTKINDPEEEQGEDLFSLELLYNEQGNNLSSNELLYNGNISQSIWKTSNDNSARYYNYDYDALNRIKGANYLSGGAYYRFSVKNITYDKNGNINRLQRTGAIAEQPDISNASDYGTMDNLSYVYDSGNKLQSVSDAGNIEYGFKDGNTSGNDYTYDANGNMLSDKNKDIINIEYNHLNLPTRVRIQLDADDYGSVLYVYDATGIKLKKRIHLDSGDPTVTIYAGNYIYKEIYDENEELQFFNHPEGYVQPNNTGNFDYIYQHKDHLGNVRLSYIKNEDYTEQTVFSDGFESISNWDKSENTLGWALTTIDSSIKKTGNYSGRIDPNYPTNYEKYVYSDTWTTISNTEDTYYSVSGWVYVEDVPNNDADVFLMVREVGETSISQAINVESTKRGAWEYVKKTLLVPMGTYEINVRVDNNKDGKVWFDDVKIVKGNTSKTVIIEESNYYPFGLKHKGYNNVTSSLGNSTAQKFGYNGKELEESLGLGWNDLGARRMDPALGRFTSPDPLADFVNYQSPYAVADNNPILYLDMQGLGIFRTIGEFFKRLGNGIAGVCGGKECRYDRFHKTSYKDTMRETDISNRVVDAVGGLIKKIGDIKIGGNKPKSNSTPSPSNENVSSFTLSEPTFPNVDVPTLPTSRLSLSQPRRPNRRPRSIVNGVNVVAGQVTNTSSNLNFGTLDLGSVDGQVISQNNNVLSRGIGNQNSLQQIANALLTNPSLRMRIDMIDPEVAAQQSNTIGRGDMLRIRQWNTAKFQSLARFLRTNFGIKPSRLSQGVNGTGGRLTFF